MDVMHWNPGYPTGVKPLVISLTEKEYQNFPVGRYAPVMYIYRADGSSFVVAGDPFAIIVVKNKQEGGYTLTLAKASRHPIPTVPVETEKFISDKESAKDPMEYNKLLADAICELRGLHEASRRFYTAYIIEPGIFAVPSTVRLG